MYKKKKKLWLDRLITMWVLKLDRKLRKIDRRVRKLLNLPIEANNAKRFL